MRFHALGQYVRVTSSAKMRCSEIWRRLGQQRRTEAIGKHMADYR